MNVGLVLLIIGLVVALAVDSTVGIILIAIGAVLLLVGR